MKRVFGVLLALFLVLSVIAHSGELVVEVANVGSPEGNINIGLFKEEGFPEAGEEFKGAQVEAEIPQVTYTFSELPAGEYAVSIFHDENENDKLDRNFLGIPREDYGFSRNTYSFRGGPPDFESASFSVKEGQTRELTVELKSWPPQI